MTDHRNQAAESFQIAAEYVNASPAADGSEGLDPALLPYLDQPVWLRENGLRCEKPDCPCEDGEILDPGPEKWILSGHTTLRTILEGLKQHAEAAL